jgi:type III secretion protein W
MALRIDNSSSQPPASGQGGMNARPEAETGVWRGARVQVAADPDDLLTDAAEEITFEHAERVESRSLEEREIEEPPPLELPPIHQIHEYLEASGHGDPQRRLEEFVDTLKRNAHQSGGAGPRQEARRQFGEGTEQYLALAFAAGELEREGGSDALLDEVRTALEELQDDFGPRLRADLNSIGAAAQFGGGDPGRVAALQGSYRDAVLGGQNLGEMLKGALERFGERDYRAAVQHLIRALGDDLAAIQGPSAQPARLNAVLQDLYSMEVLATLLEGCQKLAHLMNAEHGLPMPPAADLLQDLIGASGERWSNPGRFGAIADKYGAAEPAPRIAFLTTTRALVRDLPLKVFPDTDARANVLEAAQGALDAAVALEEDA